MLSIETPDPSSTTKISKRRHTEVNVDLYAAPGPSSIIETLSAVHKRIIYNCQKAAVNDTGSTQHEEQYVNWGFEPHEIRSFPTKTYVPPSKNKTMHPDDIEQNKGSSTYAKKSQQVCGSLSNATDISQRQRSLINKIVQPKSDGNESESIQLQPRKINESSKDLSNASKKKTSIKFSSIYNPFEEKLAENFQNSKNYQQNAENNSKTFSSIGINTSLNSSITNSNEKVSAKASKEKKQYCWCWCCCCCKCKCIPRREAVAPKTQLFS